jgi:hypothetical protein
MAKQHKQIEQLRARIAELENAGDAMDAEFGGPREWEARERWRKLRDLRWRKR